MLPKQEYILNSRLCLGTRQDRGNEDGLDAAVDNFLRYFLQAEHNIWLQIGQKIKCWPKYLLIISYNILCFMQSGRNLPVYPRELHECAEHGSGTRDPSDDGPAHVWPGEARILIFIFCNFL